MGADGIKAGPRIPAPAGSTPAGSQRIEKDLIRERGLQMATKTKSASPPPVEYATAMDKIRDEMAKSKDNYVQVVGEYLTDYLLAHPEAEAALLEKGKSIEGSLAAVRKEAEKVKTGNMAILDVKTVFGIVAGYFGLKPEPDVIKTEGNVIKTEGNVPAEAGTSFVTAGAVPPSPKGKAFGETGQDTIPDPFDLDALMGVMG